MLRDTNLCVDLRDLKAAYLTSPHLRDIYLYLLQNRMPLGKGAAKRLDQNARNYLILDGLLCNNTTKSFNFLVTQISLYCSLVLQVSQSQLEHSSSQPGPWPSGPFSSSQPGPWPSGPFSSSQPGPWPSGPFSSS